MTAPRGIAGEGTTPVRTIVVGFDGSPDAQIALRWATRLGEQLAAEVVVVHAVGLLEHANAHAHGHATTPTAEVDALEADARRIGDESGRPVRWRLADGDPVSVLLRAGQDLGADLLVVGSRGQGAHAAMLLGSTSLELAEHSPVPLLIVPTR